MLTERRAGVNGVPGTRERGCERGRTHADRPAQEGEGRGGEAGLAHRPELSPPGVTREARAALARTTLI